MSTSQTRKELMIAGTAVAAILVGFLAVQQSGAISAIATKPRVLSFDTIPLEDLELGPGQFILLVDSTPARIESAHVALNVPCEIDGKNAETNIAVVRGVAPNVSPAELEFVAPLSADEKHCVFHVTLPEGKEKITDIAMINIGDNRIGFRSGNFVTTSVTTAND